MEERMVWALFGCLLLSGAISISAATENAPGVTDNEIKIGQTMPYTGPAAPFSAPGLAEKAYMKMINDQGGINGRKINLISVDDGYLPWRTGNETRKLIEVERVAFTFGSIGTATQVAVARSFERSKSSAAVHRERRLSLGQLQGHSLHDWGRAPELPPGSAFLYPTSSSAAPAKLCILYQNNDFGRDYPAGVRDVLGVKYAEVVKEATYEFTDASIDRQIVQLKGTGCNALIAATILQFAVQTIRKVNDLGWKPIFYMSNVSASVPNILERAGLESSVGLLSSTYRKDPDDPEFENDPAMKDWRAWISKYLPDADVRRPNFINGYNSAAIMVQVLKQAGSDLSRENIMRQATNLRDLELPMLLPGIKVNTSPTDYYPVQNLQLMRFDGKRWVRFGDLLYGD